MKIIIDLQGAQTSGSRNRGIGRYSIAIAKALVELGSTQGHEMLVACNNAFPSSIAWLREQFEPILTEGHFVVWNGPSSARHADPNGRWASSVGERIREDLLRELAVDAVLVTSLMEGFGDPAIGAMPEGEGAPISAVILYDLIPLIYEDVYLRHRTSRQFYFHRLGQKKQADLLLAISEASRQDAIDHLQIDPDKVVNIAGAVDDCFCQQDVGAEEAREVFTRYGLKPDFIMYTGGIGDFRKNTDALVEGYALLPASFRHAHPLAIVCKVNEEGRRDLAELAKKCGLGENEIIVTGFVPDSDLVLLYNLCGLFIFPSLYEGFGLPVLEAMSCGAPTISGGNSSLLEINELPGASFDASSPQAIAEAMHTSFTIPGRLDEMRAYARKRAQDFSWANCARATLVHLERLHVKRLESEQRTLRSRRPRLGFVAPLPPLASGIADHAAALIKILEQDYEIDLIVDQDDMDDDWLIGNHRIIAWNDLQDPWAVYDQMIFHLGNSHFHRHMPGMIETFGGVIVLHDFFMSGMMSNTETTGGDRSFWARPLMESHGYVALLERAQAPLKAALHYPSNLGLLDRADGVIVHSSAPATMFAEIYGEANQPAWAEVPLYRGMPRAGDRTAARATLGLAADSFVVCSFGVMGETKCSDALIDAWLESPFAADPNARLIFVGVAEGAYAEALQHRIANDPRGRGIVITGQVAKEVYETYHVAADVAVQLRRRSRGESSGSVLDCLARGLPTVINAHGTMADIDPSAVLCLADSFTAAELASALERLSRDPEERRRLGETGRAYVMARYSSESVRSHYREALERFKQTPRAKARRLALTLRQLAQEQGVDVDTLADVARSLSAELPPRVGAAFLFVDVTSIRQQAQGKDEGRALIASLVRHAALGWRVRPVYFDEAIDNFRHAVAFTCTVLGLETKPPFADDPADLRADDRLLVLDVAAHPLMDRPEGLATLVNRGVGIALFAGQSLATAESELLPLPSADDQVPSAADVAVFLIAATENQRQRLQEAADAAKGTAPRIFSWHPSEPPATLLEALLA